VTLPPLRARPSDIGLLAESLLARISEGRPRTLSREALARLQRYDFPGNIRELRNILERANLLADGDLIGCEHLPVDAQARGRVAGPTLEDAERRALDEALKAHAGSRRSLAATLGISERTLYRKLRRLNLGPTR